MMKTLVTILFACFVAGCASPPERGEPPTVTAIRSIILPEVDFQNAAMSDVVEFISLHGPGCNGHSGLHAWQDIEGDQVVYRLQFCPHDLHDEGSPPCILDTVELPPIVRLGPEITLSTNSVSTFNLIRVVVDYADADLEIRRDSILIKTRRVKQTVPPYSERAAYDPF